MPHQNSGFVSERKQPLIINCDAAPYLPPGWSIHLEDQIDSAVSGELVWDPTQVSLYVSKGQQERTAKGYIKGYMLHEELKGLPVLKAQVLDALLEHPEEIPDNLNTKFVCFWTVYRLPDDYRVVRYLYWDFHKWGWDYTLLAYNWQRYHPAAFYKSGLRN